MADNWQETAQLYEQLFQKPKMKENLLQKPPFRYLHDIFSATMGKTGFGNGMFVGEELDSKSFQDKDSKLAFLVKLITLTEMMAGEKIDIKPSMVLAGQQADKTNSWLQLMFHAATSGVDSTPYVQQIMGVGPEGEEGEQQQEEGEGEEEQPDNAADGEAQRQAQEEQQRQQAEMEKQARRKKAEDKKLRQKQAEEEERRRQEQEEYERQQQELQMQQEMEQNMMMQQQMQQDQMQQQQQLIRDGEEEEEDDRANMQVDPEQDQDPSAYEGRGGALVEQAKAMMKEDDDQAPQGEEEAKGPKIKMSKIGRKKKGAPEEAAKDGTTAKKSAGLPSYVPTEKGGSTGGGFSEQDIEFMKKAIQVLCQSTNPLGKSIDFVTDDIDAMEKEYQKWKIESQSCQTQLKEQQKITEEVIQPLQDQLAELEEKIKEKTSQVNGTKSSIMRNDITIQNLLYSVITLR